MHSSLFSGSRLKQERAGILAFLMNQSCPLSSSESKRLLRLFDEK